MMLKGMSAPAANAARERQDDFGDDDRGGVQAGDVFQLQAHDGPRRHGIGEAERAGDGARAAHAAALKHSGSRSAPGR